MPSRFLLDRIRRSFEECPAMQDLVLFEKAVDEVFKAKLPINGEFLSLYGPDYYAPYSNSLCGLYGQMWRATLTCDGEQVRMVQVPEHCAPNELLQQDWLTQGQGPEYWENYMNDDDGDGPY
jgi:hypothetical protein